VGDADENLDHQKIIHVFLFRETSSRRALIRLGKRVKATIRQLGYPTKNALKSWYREYEQRRDLCAHYPVRTQKYSETEKQAALEHGIRSPYWNAGERAGHIGRQAAWLIFSLPDIRSVKLGGSYSARSPSNDSLHCAPGGISVTLSPGRTLSVFTARDMTC
jgi:hypothetical protein